MTDRSGSGGGSSGHGTDDGRTPVLPSEGWDMDFERTPVTQAERMIAINYMRRLVRQAWENVVRDNPRRSDLLSMATTTAVHRVLRYVVRHWDVDRRQPQPTYPPRVYHILAQELLGMQAVPYTRDGPPIGRASYVIAYNEPYEPVNRLPLAARTKITQMVEAQHEATRRALGEQARLTSSSDPPLIPLDPDVADSSTPNAGALPPVLPPPPPRARNGKGKGGRKGSPAPRSPRHMQAREPEQYGRTFAPRVLRDRSPRGRLTRQQEPLSADALWLDLVEEEEVDVGVLERTLRDLRRNEARSSTPAAPPQPRGRTLNEADTTVDPPRKHCANRWSAPTACSRPP